MACVAYLRFFVIPYIRVLHSSPPESPILCRVQCPDTQHSNGHLPLAPHEPLTPPSPLVMFRLGVQSHDTGGTCITLVPTQGSHKIKPLLQADCWVVFSGNKAQVKSGAVLNTLPLYPASFGIG